jgi:DNA-binding NtrC family response regulator
MPGEYKVLIVGDDHSHSETLAHIFSMRGYLVRTAYCAEQAIETLAAWEPALAIVDIVLPQMNGIDLAILIREHLPACNVLLISGRLISTSEAEESADNAHLLNTLVKPIPVNDLLETASALLSAKTKPDA